jgi:hypothetical protein
VRLDFYRVLLRELLNLVNRLHSLRPHAGARSIAQRSKLLQQIPVYWLRHRVVPALKRRLSVVKIACRSVRARVSPRAPLLNVGLRRSESLGVGLDRTSTHERLLHGLLRRDGAR